MLGPLFGAAVLAVADWRWIFWINLAVALVLAVLLHGWQRPRRPLAVVAGVLACISLALTLLAPERLATDVTLGVPFVPFTGESRLATPIGVVTLVLFAVWALLSVRGAGLGTTLRAGGPGRCGPARAGAGRGRARVRHSGPGAGGDGAGRAVAAGRVRRCSRWRSAFWQRRTPRAIVPPGLLGPRAAWGALAVSFLVGAALIAALVDVPVFARTTIHGGDQLGGRAGTAAVPGRVAGRRGRRRLAHPPVRARRDHGHRAGAGRQHVRADDRLGARVARGTWARPSYCWPAGSGSAWRSRRSTRRSWRRRRTTATVWPAHSWWSRGWSACWSACRH